MNESLREKCPGMEFFWSVPVQIGWNTDLEHSVFENFSLNEKFLKVILTENIYSCQWKSFFSESGTLISLFHKGFFLGAPLQKLAPVSIQVMHKFPTTGGYTKTKDVLNIAPSPVCDWFIDNMLSIHYREDKTNSILFSKTKGLKKLISPSRE